MPRPTRSTRCVELADWLHVNPSRCSPRVAILSTPLPRALSPLGGEEMEGVFVADKEFLGAPRLKKLPDEEVLGSAWMKPITRRYHRPSSSRGACKLLR